MLKRLSITLMCLVCLFHSFLHGLTGNLYAESEHEKRLVWAGLELFPSFLAADQDIASKANADGKLLIVLLFRDDSDSANKMAASLMAIKGIRGISIEIKVEDLNSLHRYKKNPPAGIFLTQRFYNDIEAIVRFGIENKILVFSPFIRDVESGVPCGIFVGDRILPYVNKQALNNVGIRLKDFFLRVAKYHE
ncbi:MAG: hypothetical protein HQL06_07455 [Nitrospirae bacterium]|nr:hypothetical protein [Nitrospirota bacterium]